MIPRSKWLMLLMVCLGLWVQANPSSGQDVGAIKIRLMKAIKANEIDFIHAAAMMEALEQVSEDQRREKEIRRHRNDLELEYQLKHSDQMSNLEMTFEREMEQIEFALASKRITPEVAERERKSLEQEFERRIYQQRTMMHPPAATFDQSGGSDSSDLAREAFFDQAVEEVKGAISKGEITREQARERLGMLKKSLWGEAVKQPAGGKADKPYQEKSKRPKKSTEKPSKTEQREQQQFFQRATLQMKQAIEAGHVSPEEGRERLLKLKQRIENAERNRDKDGQ